MAQAKTPDEVSSGSVSRGLFMGLAALAISLGGCQCGGREVPTESSDDATLETAAPTRTPIATLTDVTVGGHPANGVALHRDDGDHLALTLRRSSRVVDVGPDGTLRELDLGGEILGGITAMPGGEIGLLEVLGDRLFKVDLVDDALHLKGELQVGSGPRLMVAGPGGRAWVLTASHNEALVELDWPSMTLVNRRAAGRRGVDMILDGVGTHLVVADFDGDAILFRRLDADTFVVVKVSDKPYLLTPIEGEAAVVVLHSNSPVVTLIEDQAVATHTELQFVPTALAVSPSAVYVLSAGAGKLSVLDRHSLKVATTVEVPVGSSDLRLQSAASRLLVSTDQQGHIAVFEGEGGALVKADSVAVGERAGRIFDAGGGRFWTLGPDSGRALRFALP